MKYDFGIGGGGKLILKLHFDPFEVKFWWELLHFCMEIISFAYRFACYEVRILQSHTTITFIQSQGHKDLKNQHLL